MKKDIYTLSLCGKDLSAEFTDLAENAGGSVLLRYGHTAVFATVCSGEERNDIDYFPLSVEYEERFYAAGQILGSRFMRREGRPSEEAILSGRIIDRTIRPLFPQGMKCEVQVVLTVLSIAEDDPDVLGVIATSLALGTSSLPWNGPVSAVRIGKNKEGNFIINPTYSARKEKDSIYDVLVCGKEETINMIEVGAKEVKEEEIASAFEKGIEINSLIEKWQKDIIEKRGLEKKEVSKKKRDENLSLLFEKKIAEKMPDFVFSRKQGYKGLAPLLLEWQNLAENAFPETNKKERDDIFNEKVDILMQRGAVEEKKRADGRKLDEVREIYAQAGGLSPILHGSGIFYRGGTHVFTALTLGGPQDSLIVDSIEHNDEHQRFMHHYNFPPYSVGETGRMGGLNRRAVGHGALAEKALEAVLPSKEEFPYTIRLVSECMASNGSTSQASICASTLALMDGGVPISAPVAGIAMGLMLYEGKHAVLTDIQGPEDHHGHMDFKVAGTRKGVTAIQMDIKLDGVPLAILIEALEGAKVAREHILDVMEKEIATPRNDISPLAPKIVMVKVKEKQIGLVIGSGGKTINGIKDESGVSDITIEEDGTVFITGVGGSAEKARDMIEELVREFTQGEIVEGEVVKVLDFGAFVKLNATTEGMVHISEVSKERIENIHDHLKVGQKVKVVVKGRDEKGRLGLSMKQVS